MYLFVLIAFLVVGLVAVGALVYNWLIVSHRNQAYGTIILPRKRGQRGAGPIERCVAGVRSALVNLVKPIDWRNVGMRAGLVRIDSNTRPAGRR